jgi:predicted transposase/invertase (TIGR01784 family)
MEKGKEEGREEGIEEGRRQQAEAIARSLLELGLDMALITQTTGLSEKQVKQLIATSNLGKN